MTADTHARARRHHALSDPLRLAIVDRLVLGDVAPDELSRDLDVPTNLLAHHLNVLVRAGLVERRPSHGDRRRRYLHLVAGALDQLVASPRVTASSVLFVCTGNSARSQLAAALWRQRSPIAASSAGSEPARRVHPLAIRTAAAHGLRIAAAAPRDVATVHEAVGLVVTVCDRAREGHIAIQAPRVHWSVADPAARATRQAFEQAFSELQRRVDDLAPRVSAA